MALMCGIDKTLFEGLRISQIFCVNRQRFCHIFTPVRILQLQVLCLLRVPPVILGFTLPTPIQPSSPYHPIPFTTIAPPPHEPPSPYIPPLPAPSLLESPSPFLRYCAHSPSPSLLCSYNPICGASYRTCTFFWSLRRPL